MARAREVPAILVVDDDRDSRDGLAEVLTLAGYVVSTAANGKSAWEQVHGHRPDLIIIDLAMPVMSGWQFMEAQRRDPELALIPVIVASASIDSRVEGAAGLLRKPFDVDTLLTMVARTCGLGGEHDGGEDPAMRHRAQISAALAPDQPYPEMPA